jgi:large subunit ribosomal protein L4
MNRKERRLALRTAFLSRSEDLIVVENFASQFSTPKTKDLLAAMSRWGVGSGDKILLVMDELVENIYLSARNVASLKLVPADGLNVFDILHANKIVVTAEALAKIQEVYND